MAAKRPYFSSTGAELSSIFESNRQDAKVLRDLLAELKHRSTPTAQSLKREVEAALTAVKASGAKTLKPEAPPPPPSHHTLTCQSCSTAVRVPVRSERTAYSCPTCKAEFETVFNDGLLQAVWIKAKRTKDDSATPMTDALARAILGVAPSADFAAIKAAWRRASQQYRPDKHQGLPERLRKAAEFEMKRINEAYRFLEGSTATDF